MSPPRSAVVVPVEGASLAPGSERWETFFGKIRGPGVDVFGLYPIAGILHERDALRNPYYVAAHGTSSDRTAIEEGALRLRSWLYAVGPTYDQIVFLAGGPLAPIWTRGVAGTSLAQKIKVIPIRNKIAGRGGGSAVIQGLPGLDGTIVRSRLLNVLGRGA